MTMNGQIKLGDRVRDKISGYEGIAIATCEWLNGCVRIAIQPEKLDKEGKHIEDLYFDVGQVELVEAGAFYENATVPVAENRPPGGPRRAPKNCVSR